MPNADVRKSLIIDKDNKAITHWQLGNLHQALQHFPDPRKAGFWFPQELLRMNNGKQRRMARIMLRGATKAGKTMMALMSACPSTYNDSRPLGDFTYASGETAEPWAELLKSLDLLSRVSKFGAITDSQPTRGARYIRATFYGGNNGRGADWSKSRAAVFYDFPGEHIENDNSGGWADLMTATDIVAAVLDVNDFFDQSPASFERIGMAVKTLQSYGQAARALVITKVDTHQELQSCIGANARECLGRLCDAKNPVGRNLRDEARSAHVFFIGTKGLNSLKTPQAEGLQDFIDWALAQVGGSLPIVSASVRR